MRGWTRGDDAREHIGGVSPAQLGSPSPPPTAPIRSESGRVIGAKTAERRQVVDRVARSDRNVELRGGRGVEAIFDTVAYRCTGEQETRINSVHRFDKRLKRPASADRGSEQQCESQRAADHAMR